MSTRSAHNVHGNPTLPTLHPPGPLGYNPEMDKIGVSLCPMCGASISQGAGICPGCGEKLPSHSNQVTPRRSWRQRAGFPAAILMFLIGFGLLLWVGVKLFVVIIFGGSISELWPLLAASVLPFLVGWDFLPGTKRKGDPPSGNPPAADQGTASEIKGRRML